MEPSDLRVALFSGNYNYVRDGANQSLNLLVGYLLERGVKVRVYSPTVPEPAFPPVGDLVDVPSFPMFAGRGEYKLARGLPARPRADLEAFAPNIVHVSAPEILGHAAVRWARRNSIPAVASFHTRFETYCSYYGLGFLEPLVKYLMTRFYNRFDRVLVPSNSMMALLAEWGVTAPMGIWSRGINHDRFRPDRRDLAWRRSLGIADHEMAVGFLGRLVKEKGLDIFAEVSTELKRRGVAHKVLVVGEGPARDWFAEAVPDAVFTGFQSGDALGRAVASMDVFFNPSVTETFGNVTTEAMASAVPVVAARATGAVDLVEDGVNGFLVPPRDVAAYADAIARIVADPALREAMGEAGHRKAAGYRWDVANQAVLDAYLALERR
ncbi:glycosyltransferase family 4 protein [Sphingomonas lycopersici]|uniref:Glycosyltransferase family 1 protein n=1 Tax=Sphingomonas lycopersici TaxID=2951807 RepID=A0AA41Z6I9_9SPHN|nr:glycosyltransferase family 1 protein [Sphingomonas lycopersici]MCW6529633.1 glycosyltransferase family 1 protein [Sphingomonas lycopersici]MCW6534445.1 glycosyltransferase family 1 protein [Sphingomonas lycopersici]